MNVILRAGTVACAALALAVPAAASAAPSAAATAPAAAAAKPAKATGFVPVPLSVQPTAIASPADGVVYVASKAADGSAVITRVTRTWKGFTSEKVTLAAPLTGTPQLVAAGGHVYAFASGTLLDITGTTSRKLVLPTRDDLGNRVTFTVMTADTAGSIWIGGGNPLEAGVVKPGNVAFHGDGTTWTQLTRFTNPMEGPIRSYSTGAHYFEIVASGSVGLVHGAREWNGSVWEARPRTGFSYVGWDGYAEEWTFVSATDYTMWGYGSTVSYPDRPGQPMHGTCTHVVDGVSTFCAAPTWGVSAAVRLADGRVVLGGFDGKGVSGGLVDGGFAIVPTPGATPVPIAGEEGDRVVDLAAAPTGETVWAITSTGGTTSLQVMGPRLFNPKSKRASTTSLTTR